MISIVNGYVCTSSCEAAAAKQGRDPHAPPGTPPWQSDKKSGIDGQPATILGGAFNNLVNSTAVASGAASSNNAQPSLDIMA